MNIRKSVVLSIVGFLLVAAPANAHHQQQVLGDSTTAASIPPTVEGPGALLPDSPLYFLDSWKQQARLALALSPENKAKIHKEIAGERLAELRVMLVKGNQKGAQVALEGVSTNYKSASENVVQAQLAGKDISTLAKTINDDIKTKLEVLDTLEVQTNGEMAARVKAASSAMLVAKVNAEDSLNPADLDNAVKEDLERQAHKELEETTSSVEHLQESLDALEAQASDAAKQSQKNREDAIKKAIEEHNTELEKATVAAVERQNKEETESLRLRQELAEQTRKTMEEAKKTAKKFAEVKEGKKNTETTTTTPANEGKRVPSTESTLR